MLRESSDVVDMVDVSSERLDHVVSRSSSFVVSKLCSFEDDSRSPSLLVDWAIKINIVFIHVFLGRSINHFSARFILRVACTVVKIAQSREIALCKIVC